MSVNPSVESLRAQATRDREFFKAQSQRLIEIQQSDPNTLNDVDRNALSNWDKSVVTDCNRQLLRLEDIKQPSPEERAVMKELHELIILGDHIMEKRNLVRAELNDRLNAVKKCKASKSAPMHGDKVKPATMSLRETSEVTDQTATVRTTSATTGAVPETVSVPTASVDTPHTLPDGQMNDPGTGSVHDSIDGEAIGPTILYETLGVEPDATLNEIKKAIRKVILRLHPDRNPDDPNAASRFSDFQAACKVFESEKTRLEFDETGDVKEIGDLQACLQSLAIKR